MQLFMVNGPSCAGKSTIVKEILKQRKWIFHLHRDSLKWWFSDYSPDKYNDDIRKIMLAIAQTVFSLGYTVICDFSLFREQREEIINAALTQGYDVIEVNIEADYAVLVSRFEERMESVRREKTRVSNTSLSRFKELYDIYDKDKNIEAITYRSDLLSPEVILTYFSNLIRQ